MTIPLRHLISDSHRGLHIGTALRLVWRSTPGWTTAGAILVLIQGLLPLLALYLMKLVVDVVELGLKAPDTADVFKDAIRLVCLIAGVAVLEALLRSLAGIVREAQTQAFSDYMYGLLHAKSVEIDLAYYESPEYFDTLHRAQQEGPTRPLAIVNSLVQLGQSAVSLTAIVGLLVSLHWAVAVILFVTAVPDVLVRLKYANKVFRWQRKRTSTQRWAQYYNLMLTTRSYAKEVRLFGLGEVFIERFRALRRKLRRERIDMTARRSLAEFLSKTITTLAVLATFTFFIYQTIAGIITLGSMVMYYQALRRGQGFLQELMGSVTNLYENNLFLSNLHEFMELKPQAPEPLHPAPVPRPMEKGIVFEHVDFQYPGADKKALEDINLTIEPGEQIALVGENGSGKTTLIKLLCRLYDPLNGRINLDGADLRLHNTADWRREISVIFQDYVQYHLTARENIWLSNAVISPDQERIAAAAALSGADEVIRQLSRGYDTVLGKRFKDGEELSIGQWQKIALARAFHRDAQIIVLDEPTSALDARAEYELFEHFRTLIEGKTAILISHRFSTVKSADRIYVMEHGRIIEAGAHEELMRRNGKYAGLFQMQASHYR